MDVRHKIAFYGHRHNHRKTKDKKYGSTCRISLFYKLPQGLTTKKYVFINIFVQFPEFFYNSVGDFRLFLQFILLMYFGYLLPNSLRNIATDRITEKNSCSKKQNYRDKMTHLISFFSPSAAVFFCTFFL
jgi:hypothetical protein